MLASRMSRARPSATKAATARAAELKADGRDIIILTQGEPDFDTPEHVRTAGIRAINEGHTRYTAVAGAAALREAIRARIAADYRLDYPIEQITVGAGAKQIIFNAFVTTLDPGDEVIVPAPCWVSYPKMAQLLGGAPKVIDCSAALGFKLSPDRLSEALGPRSKWIVLNSPNNPPEASIPKRR